MRTIFLSTIHHRAHEYIRSTFDHTLELSTHPVRRFLDYRAAAKVLRYFDLAIIETIYSLAYLWSHRSDFETSFIPIVTSFPYVFSVLPSWYFADTRATGFRVPAFLRKQVLLRAYRMTRERSIGYICVSKMIQRWLRNLDDKPSVVVYPSMDPENLREIDSLERFEYPPGIFSYIGSGPQKGVDITLRVVDLVLREHPGARFYLRVSKHVYRLHRRLFREILERHGSRMFLAFQRLPWSFIRSRASVYLQASYVEPFGVAVAEAMYARMIPVVSKTVGAKELFEQEFPWLVSDLDPESLAERILRALELQETKKHLIAQQLRTLAEITKPENLINEFKIKFSKLLDSSGLGR